jgi:hypothetical protein
LSKKDQALFLFLWAEQGRAECEAFRLIFDISTTWMIFDYHKEAVIFFHFFFKTRFVIVIIETRQKESK